MAILKIDQGRLVVTDRKTLNISFQGNRLELEFDQLDIEFGDGIVLHSLRVGSEAQGATSAPESSRTSRRKVAKRKAADYIVEVFRLVKRPLKTPEIADLLPEITEYEPTATKLVNTVRTALTRDNRFRQLDSFTWSLRELEPEWVEQGLIPRSVIEADEKASSSETGG